MKIGSVSIERAKLQHQNFADALIRAGAEIIKLPFLHGAFDSVFMKDNGVIFRMNSDDSPKAILANPRFENRKLESSYRTKEFNELGIETMAIDSGFEGGDFVILPNTRLGFLGYGFRSDSSAAQEISTYLKREVIALKLCDPYFYHLDTALNFIEWEDRGTKRIIAFAHWDAFDQESLHKLKSCDEISEIIFIDRKEALAFALNWVEVNGVIITGTHAPELESILRGFGKKVHMTPLDEFQRAGGSAACLASKIFVMNQKSLEIHPSKKIDFYEKRAQ